MTGGEGPFPSRGALLDYFVDACKPRERWLVGMEMEKIGRHRVTGEPLPYDGARPSIRSVLEQLRETAQGLPVYEGNHLIGLDGDWGSVSLEPGGQVEWSSRPAPGLERLAADLDRHLARMQETGERLGVEWLDVAVDPVHPVERMEWMPKARYKIMRPYMGARGRLSHRMMTQTASIQCAFDFESPADWARKFRAAVLMAPVSVALFANSGRVDDRESGYRSYRQAIWRETAPERTGLPAVPFQPGFDVERWVDWILEVPSMFRSRCRGLIPAGGVPFSELMERTGCDALRAEDWELHLSSIFTEVRSYTYIEVRSADLQPDHRIMTVPTFWTGLLYDESSLGRALELGAPWDGHERWYEAMESAARDGVDAVVRGTAIRETAREALRVSAAGLRAATPCVDDPTRARARLTELADHVGIDIG